MKKKTQQVACARHYAYTSAARGTRNPRIVICGQSVDSYTTSPSISMAPVSQKYLCPCCACNSLKLLTKRTIQGHLRQNQAQLQDAIAFGSSQQTIDYLQSCFRQTTQLLAGLAGGSQASSQSAGLAGVSQASSQSPHPDGVYLVFNIL